MDLVQFRAMMAMAEINGAKMVLFTVLVLGMAYLWMSLALVSLRLDSMREAFQRFQRNPAAASWVERYFYGFVIWSRFPFAQRMLLAQGSKLTWWYKLQGAGLLLFSVFAVAMVAFMWFVLLTVPLVL